MMLAQLLLLAALTEGQTGAGDVNASKFSAPRLTNDKPFISSEDYPDEAVHRNQEGFVISSITVDISGKIEQCKTTHSSGYRILDSKTCNLIKRRAKFLPAIYVDGKPSFGLITFFTKWHVDPEQEEMTYSDISVEISRLPDNLESPKRIYLAVAVDADGKPLACRYTEYSSQTVSPIDSDNPQLIKIGCQQVMARTLSPARTQNGRATPSVQGVQVMFTTPSVNPD